MTETPQVLIVDDDPINVKVLETKLKKEGISTHAAMDGRECLSIVETMTPGLILLDIMMPHIDGFEVCKRLKSNSRFDFIPIMFVSAKTSKESIDQGLSLGAIDYISKPVDLNQLALKVHAHRKNYTAIWRVAKEQSHSICK